MEFKGTKDYLFIVVDETINQGDWAFETLNGIHFKVKGSGNYYGNSSFKKIINHLPLKNAPKLEGLDVMFNQAQDYYKLKKEHSQMLEMLKFFVENNMLSIVGEETAKQLIKEATEIKN